MKTYEKFEFFSNFNPMIGLHDVKAGDKMLDLLCKGEKEVCLGQRVVGGVTYQIFYFKDRQFCVFHSGTADIAELCTTDLDTVVRYVNNIKPEDNMIH